MHMTRLRLPLRLVAVTALVAALVAPTLGASARTHPVLRVSGREPVSRAFPGFGNTALRQTAVERPDPQDCAQAAHCDTIPMLILLPTDVGPGDEITLEVVVDWQHRGQNNDMDVFFWDDKQVLGDEPNGCVSDPSPVDQGASWRHTNCYSLITEAAGGGQVHFPERFIVREPQLPDHDGDGANYNLVVINLSNRNDGYTVNARFLVEKFEPPGEVIEEDPVPTIGGRRPPDDDGFGPSFGGFFGDGGAGGPEGVAAGLTLDLLDITPDDVLGSLTSTDLAGLLRGPPQTTSALGPGDHPPPSTLALVLWLGVLPGAVLGGVLAFLLRRRAQLAIG